VNWVLAFTALSLGLVSSVGSAFDIGEVTCHAAGCMNEGFVYRDFQSGLTWETECFEEGCETGGWTQFAYQRPEEYVTECEGDGCFKDGYTTIDRFTREYIGRVVCHQDDEGKRDCLKNGWSTFARNWSWVTECRGQDCRRNGWRLRTHDGRLQQATCKEKDCFGKGWVLEQM